MDVQTILAKARTDSDISAMTTSAGNLIECDLGGVDCPICHNRGVLMRYEDGILVTIECECMANRRSMRRIRKSNMEDMLSRYTFDAYETPDEERKQIKTAALDFANSNEGWFYIAGQSGSGKTHICTAICSRLIDRGKEVYYMRWRDESRQLKGLLNTQEIEAPLEKLKKVPVLYIDDFFKGGANDADVRMAFEILNARYNDTKLRTVISSEYPIKKLLSIDEALGGRIWERSAGYRLSAPRENWRLR